MPGSIRECSVSQLTVRDRAMPLVLVRLSAAVAAYHRRARLAPLKTPTTSTLVVHGGCHSVGLRHCCTNSPQERPLAGGRLRQHGFEGAEMSDVVVVLLASPLVRAAGLRAHEGLRRASPIGDMGHVPRP